MSKKVGFVSREASYQIADFSTQVQMGTSAVTAFGMQAPNLINSFTQVGLVSGKLALPLLAVSAALPIVAGAYKYFSSQIPQAGAAQKKFAEDTSASIDKLVGKIGELNTDALEKADTKAKDAIKSAGLLAEKFTAVQTAEASFTAAAKTNAETNIASQGGMLSVLGLQQEKFKEIQILADLQVKALQAAAAAKIAEVNAMREQAVLEAWKATMEIKRSEAKKISLEADLVAQQRVLDLVTKQNRETEKSAVKRSNESPLWDMAGSMVGVGARVFAGDYPGALRNFQAADPSAAMTKHVQNQGADDYDARTAESRRNMETGARSRVDGLASDIEKVKEETATNEALFDNLSRKINASDQASAIKIEEITQTLQSTQTAAQIDQLNKTATQNVADIEGVLSNVTATSAQEAPAFSRLKQAVADHIIDARELPQVVADLQTLLGSYQSGFMQMSGSTTENVRMVTAVQAQLAEQVKLTREAGIQSAGVSADQKLLRAEFERWKNQLLQNQDRGTQ
ncbi:MAG: hypothetical protein WCP45_04765 [Verrucomicrobiota bacterium]